MSNNEDLKPCPFCGGEAYLYNPAFLEHYVICRSCGLSSLLYNSDIKAIAAWNRRVCVKQNSETLDTNSVASNPLNAKLTYDDIKKMVMPLEWELECENGDSVAKLGKALFRISYWDNEAKYIVFCNTTIIKGGFASLEKAKQAAQEFLVDLVAAALGVERSGE